MPTIRTRLTLALVVLLACGSSTVDQNDTWVLEDQARQACERDPDAAAQAADAGDAITGCASTKLAGWIAAPCETTCRELSVGLDYKSCRPVRSDGAGHHVIDCTYVDHVGATSCGH